MGEFANVLDFARPLRRPASSAYFEPGLIESVRLVPGNTARSSRKKLPGSVIVSHAESALDQQGTGHVLPEFIRQLRPYALGAAVADLSLLILATWFLPMWQAGIANARLIFLLVFLLVAAQSGLYDAPPKRRQHSILLKTVLWTIGFTALATHPVSPSQLIPLLLLSSVAVPVLMLARELEALIRRNPSYRRNVLIVGDPVFSAQISHAIENDPTATRNVKGCFREQEFRRRHGATMLRKTARQECIEEIIVATYDMRLAEQILFEARSNQLDVAYALPFEAAPLPLEKVGTANLLSIHRQELPYWQLGAKRALDFTLASLGLILLSPLLFVIAIWIRLDSRGSAIYRSIRIGHHGRKFVCHKFRTMVEHAEASKDELRSRNERSGAFFKISNDPRITRAGSFLRRYSLDELPQLWNVLRGDMSLVGPRPHPADDVEKYDLRHLQRLDASPGMTGLWQVTARRDPSFERCVELDVAYIKHWTPLLDLKILCKTIACVLQGSGV